MKRSIRLRSILFLLPMLVFFCQYQNGFFCFGNNDGESPPGIGAGSNIAIGNNCPSNFPFPNQPTS